MVIRDSLSKCESNPYSSLYSTQPKSISSPQSASPVSQDTIENIGQQLKQEALSRLRHTSKYRIFQQGFMRVGQYLFLAIALPPYLLIYGIPKWILVEALPFAVSLCGILKKKLQQKIQKRIQTVIHYAHIVKQFIQGTIQKLVQPIAEAFSALQQKMHALWRPVPLFFKRMGQTLKRPFQSKKNSDGEASLFKRLQTQLVQTGKWISAHYQSIRQTIQDGILWIKYQPRRLLVRGIKYFEQTTLPRLAEKYGSPLQTSVRWANQALNWIFKPLSLSMDGYAWTKQQIKESYRQHVTPLLQAFNSWMAPKWQVFATFMDAQTNRLTAFFDHLKSKCFSWSQPEFVAQLFQSPYLAWLSKNKAGLWLQMLVRWILKAASYAFASLAFLTRYVKHGYLSARQWLKLIYQKGRTFYQKVSTPLKHSIRVVLNFVGRIFYQGLFGFLVILFMMGLIAIWSVRLVVDTGNRLLNRISLTRFQTPRDE